eukprot:TRINITY_DN10510_c0_g1_i1.p1 TRINITY_DN10510_c0_g1~~TRINITY_DN10510_c0_g1_i1.p1  ORF type:complete len:268 (-),score=40.13 TRINITY_DN10510_c0_g1_i1:91-894(-)
MELIFDIWGVILLLLLESTEDQKEKIRQFLVLRTVCKQWKQLTDRDFKFDELECTKRFLSAVAQSSEKVEFFLGKLKRDQNPNSSVWNLAFSEAARGRDPRTFQLLLEDGRANLTFSDDLAFRRAAFTGEPRVIELILAQEAVNPSSNSNEALRFASAKGNTEVVSLLLEDPRVDPNCDGCCSFATACVEGHADVSSLFLNCPRFEPQWVNWKSVIKKVIELNFTDVLTVLMEDGRFDNILNNKRVLRHATSYETRNILLSRRLLSV